MIEWIQTNWPILAPVVILVVDMIVKWTQTDKDDTLWEKIRSSIPVDPKQPAKKSDK